MGGYSRRGLRPAEVVVLITVLAVLGAILVPAILALRESARRTRCAGNIQQLVLALRSYHDAQGCLPVNGLVAWSGTSWMIGILPHLGEHSLYRTIEIHQSPRHPANIATAMTVVPAFLCPSDGDSDGVMENRSDTGSAAGDPRAVTNYKAVAGANWAWGDHRVSQPTGRFPNDMHGYCHGNGIICSNSYAGRPCAGGVLTTRLADISDGLSSTFAIGETVPAWTKWSWWFNSNACTSTCAIPLNYRRGKVDLREGKDDWGRNSGFFSHHPSGGNFGFCDGMVRFIRDDIDMAVYRGLATISGGEPVEPP